jgi:hypothetical protein
MRPGYQGLSPEEGRLATLPGRTANIEQKLPLFKRLIPLDFAAKLPFSYMDNLQYCPFVPLSQRALTIRPSIIGLL